MSDGRGRFVVGVDFGTTYSGIAYLQVLDDNPKYGDIEVIQTWPGKGGDADNRTMDKAPTEISFEDGLKLWGFQIPPGVKRYGCFKLLLDEKSDKTKYDDPNLDAGNPNALLAFPPGQDVYDIAFEYLRLLYDHAMDRLRKRVPLTFDSTPIQFVLTTPAIWSHEAQDATCKIAKRAGFGSRAGDTITMVAEPEAAASYCLRDVFAVHEGSENELQEGERILICDAGGGTVDLITYTVSQTSPCLRVKEANIGSGGKCGSTAIDRAFLKWLEPRVGKRFKKWTAKKIGRGSPLMMNFEMAKRGFGTSTYSQSWRIPLGNVDDNPEMGIEDGEIKITDEDMVEIFDPVVKTIIELVSQQIRDANTIGRQNRTSKVLLVGGFGESQYLQKKLKDWSQSQPFPVDVICPKHSWSAVARGAVIHGVENAAITDGGGDVATVPSAKTLVESRKLKQHYGVVLATFFDPDVHDGSTVYFDPLSRMLMADDHVEWFAAKGQEAKNGSRFPIECFTRFSEWCSDKKISLEVVGSSSDEAPRSAKRGKVHRVVQVPADLSGVPSSVFRTLVSTFRGRVLDAEIVIEMSVASADLSFEVMCKGESYGKVKVEY